MKKFIFVILLVIIGVYSRKNMRKHRSKAKEDVIQQQLKTTKPVCKLESFPNYQICHKLNSCNLCLTSPHCGNEKKYNSKTKSK